MQGNHYLQFASTFQDRLVPESGATLTGYSALIHTHRLQVPLPDRLAVISSKHRRYEKDNWLIFTPRHAPNDTLYGHLTFALKYEGIELGVLKALFSVIGPTDIEAIVHKEPTSQYSRKLWFLYEWLMDEPLNLPDAVTGNFFSIVDEKLQYGIDAEVSKRHRMRNNLPGVRHFCPMIRKTKKLESFVDERFDQKVIISTETIHSDILARASAFLLLKDSKASYAIEGEKPIQSRAQRWGWAISQAGQHRLNPDELVRLQKIVIESSRFTKHGWREQEGFIGQHDRTTGYPLPEHVSAKWQDLDTLTTGFFEAYNKLVNHPMDPVLMAAVIAFGFVFIHPFVDGNGRIHRYLIHHLLAETGFAPKGFVFPVSAVILDRLDTYRQILEAYSKPRLAFIDWKPSLTQKGNVEVLNNTIDLYRYFDATCQAEFLYECVQQTVEVVLPAEVNYLDCYDRIKDFIDNTIEMPDRLADLLIRFLAQGNGQLSERVKKKEFKELTDQEIEALEQKYVEIFQDD